MVLRNTWRSRYLIGAALLAVAAPAGAGSTIESIGDLNSNYFATQALSDDGTTAVGQLRIDGSLNHPARWTRQGGIQDLGTLASDAHNNFPYYVSANGSVVTGNFYSDSIGSVEWRWTAGGGMQPLPQGLFVSGISGDGRYLIGTTAAGPFRWSEQGGREDLGNLAGWSGSSVTGTNSDGSVVFGVAYNSTLQMDTSWRWTASGGMQDRGYPSPGQKFSADGSVSAGSRFISPEEGYRAFRWTEATGSRDLNNGAVSTLIEDISADGSTIVGDWLSSQGGFYIGAWVWTEKTGMQDLRQLLIDNGADLTGWDLRKVSGVSADGSTIVGMSTRGAFIATIPEPGAAAIWGIFALFCQARRRRPERRHAASIARLV